MVAIPIANQASQASGGAAAESEGSDGERTMGSGGPKGRAGRGFRPRHVFLTGAAGAIGSALGRVLAARHPALRFTLVDRNAEGMGELASELGDRGQSLPWDLSQPATLPALWEQATRRFGGVDLLVNCAGFMEIRSFAATPWELGDRLLQVDLVSPLRLMNLAVQGLRAAPRRADRADAAPTAGPCGWIVNISSMAGRVPLRGCSYYGAAKSGLALASQIAGLELRPRGIHVLTVLPGPVYSGLESRARAQVEPGLVSRHVPTGDPRVLAEKIERALRCRRARLVYPTIYALGDRLPGLASALAAALSPEPTDAP